MFVRVLNPKAEVLNKSAALHMTINAAKGLQNVLKSNLVPKGTIKMLVGGSGDIKLTKDGNTLLKEMIDAKVLRGVAMEYQHDVDEAAAVVISELCPLSSSNFTPSRNKNKKILGDMHDVKVELYMQSHEKSLSLSQWLQPSKLPHSYLALLNEECTPDVKPPLDYVVEKMVLPRCGAGTGAGGGIRTMYSPSSLVKPSIRVHSRTENPLFVSISKPS